MLLRPTHVRGLWVLLYLSVWAEAVAWGRGRRVAREHLWAAVLLAPSQGGGRACWCLFWTRAATSSPSPSHSLTSLAGTGDGSRCPHHLFPFLCHLCSNRAESCSRVRGRPSGDPRVCSLQCHTQVHAPAPYTRCLRCPPDNVQVASISAGHGAGTRPPVAYRPVPPSRQPAHPRTPQQPCPRPALPPRTLGM